MSHQIKILLIDDEEDVLEFLQYVLEKESFIVKTAKNGKEGLKKAETFEPDLILLDRMMPEMDGVETCKIFRANPKFDTTKIVFLTARDEESLQIEGFELGADDYIAKPIKSKLLVSKIKSIMRRSPKMANQVNIVSYKHIAVDKDRYLVLNGNDEIVLPRKEFELLSLLISKPDYVFRREDILEQIWGKEVYVGDRTIDVHIRKLREKIGDNYFSTVKGIGYKFVAF
jgi:two-component system alkaline phosphatase synthesis response regulator PhoP